MVKRARKYYLGVTTITQDVEDFLNNDFGKAIVTNASIQFLMKQSTASIPVLAETFFLSEGERQLLVTSDVGEGIFFAGQNHVAMRVVASPDEHRIITSNPEEILQMRALKKAQSLEQKISQTMNVQQWNTAVQTDETLQTVQAFQGDQQQANQQLANQHQAQRQEQVSLQNVLNDSNDAGLKTYSRPAPQKSKKLKPIVPDTEFKAANQVYETTVENQETKVASINDQPLKLSEPDSQQNKPQKQFVRYSIDDYQPPQS
jgi:hypothetical protein